MKVLLLNGSPKMNGNTSLMLQEMINVFEEEGIETELIQVGNLDVRSCIACNSCGKLGKCVFDDIVNEVAEEFESADGFVVGTPVYYAGANPTVMALLTRLFYSGHFDKRMKVGASVAVARRSGLLTTIDEINKFFTISGMPVASSQYWTGAHGMDPGEVKEDGEGLQIMRTLARNMSFLIKSIALGKEKYGLPEKEAKREGTNFVR